MSECFVCLIISKIKNGSYPFFVSDLQESFVVLSENQLYKGCFFIIYKHHSEHLEELDMNIQLRLWNEVSVVSKRVKEIFNTDRVNNASICNKVEHVHFHIMPWYKNLDPEPNEPIWCRPALEQEKAVPNKEIFEMTSKLKMALYSDRWSQFNLSKLFIAPGYGNRPINFQISNKLYSEIDQSSLDNEKNNLFEKSTIFTQFVIKHYLNPNEKSINNEIKNSLDDFISACELLCQKQENIGEDYSWREILGSDIDNFREFALYLYSVIGLINIHKNKCDQSL